MSERGSTWYKRDPIRFLDGVEGMGPELIGAYAYVLDLIYARNGKTRRDDGALAGRMGCSKRKATALVNALVERGKIEERGEFLTHKLAEEHANTTRTLSERRSNAGRTGGEKSGQVRKNKALAEASASSKTKQIREDKNTDTNVSGADAPIDFAKAIFEHGVRFLVEHGTSEQSARALIGKWRKSYDDREIFDAFKAAKQSGVTDPKSYIAAVLGGQHGKSADETDRLQRIVAAAARGSSGEDWG